MRLTGVLDEQSPLAGADHVCWVYDDPASLADAAQRFLAEGLARSERLLCVGDELVAELRAAGEPVDDLVARGAMTVRRVTDTYADGEPVHPVDQWAFYDAAVRAARADGYTGLRVVAEVTALAGTSPARSRLVEWEHLADEYIASGGGMVALCAYRRGALDPEAVADVTAVHPQVHAPQQPPAFRAWFDGAQLHLAGTLDTFSADRLARVLRTSPVTGTAVPLDLSEVEVVDVAGCRVLARWARELADRGLASRWVGTPRSVRRMWPLLGLDDGLPVTFAERAR